MDNRENFGDISVWEDQLVELLGEEVTPADFQAEFMDKLDAIIENQSDISAGLDVVIEGQSAISNALYSILGLAILAIGFKIIWTVVAKWLFGGI